MPMNRRNFVRTVVTGVTMAGVPFEKVFSQASDLSRSIQTNRRHIVREPAHQIRDGHRFPTPLPSEFKDVVIVGAGANSLTAAYHLPDLEVVCLEKEARCGGNAQRSKWRGIYFTEGAAYTGMKSDLVDFMQSEFDIAPTAVFSDIGYIAENTIIPSFFKTGFDKLPYDEATRKAFYRFRETCNATSDRMESGLWSYYRGEPITDPALRTEMEALHAMTFEQWLLDNKYPGEVLEWCDSYCPTDSSAYPRDMSALSGINGMAYIGDYDGSGTWPGGLAKMSEVLETGVRAQGANRVRTGTFVTSVENTPDGRHVDVTYLQAGILHTIRCKTCIWGGQKHIAKHVIQGMPEEQSTAIGKMKYNDISVMNLCYDRRIYDGALITWMNKAPINNILSADWVLNEGNTDPDSPQVLTCDWTNRPQNRALLLDDAWVVEQCQASARRMEEIFPGSLDHLVEIRLPLRAHSWVGSPPGFTAELRTAAQSDIGRVVMTASEHSSFRRAYDAGVENANKAREWMA